MNGEKETDMQKIGLLTLLLTGGLLAPAAEAVNVAMKLSGPGVVNDSTIKAGQKVSLDFYFDNASEYNGFSAGFRLFSPDKSIKTVTYPADSGNGMNKRGNMKAFNGWETKQIFDFGFWAPEPDADGNLPEVFGYAGVCMKQRWTPHAMLKTCGMEFIAPTAGTLVVDSSNTSPHYLKVTRTQLAADTTGLPKTEIPVWKGPYKITVVQ